MAAPWSVRLVGWIPLPPMAAGALLSALLLALLAAVELATGDLPRALRGEAPRWKVDEYVFSGVMALMLGYVPAAHALVLAACARSFDALRPALRGDANELDAARAELLRFDRARQRRAGALGVGLALLLPVAVDLSFVGYSLGDLNLTALGHRLLAPAAAWLIARQTQAMMAGSRHLARLCRERARVDLLDPSPLSPLARHGLANALLTAGLLSICALFTAAWGSRPGLTWVLAGGFALVLGLGAAGLLMPARGGRDAIRAAKRGELEWCQRAARERLDGLRQRGDAAGPPLDEVLAWRRFVESVREWPFDADTLTRFALYLAIPVGGWLGGALVERVLDALLD